jgi:YD repeat-containing protein
MNPGIYASLPASACTLGTQGTFGPDRISMSNYDVANQVTSVITALGVAGQQRNVQSLSYTSNGQLATLSDGKGNKSTYVYDGFDRLTQLQYPTASNGTVSNSSDYEQTVYDAFGRVSSVRRRNGTSIAFSYDLLSRVTVKDLPGTTSEDVYYAYDTLGQLLSQRLGSTSGRVLSAHMMPLAGLPRTR